MDNGLEFAEHKMVAEKLDIQTSTHHGKSGKLSK